MNLLDSQWIPVRRESGEAYITPWQLTDSNDPILELSAPRPDFNGALLQFLIGLLQTACPPEDSDQWADWLEKPPSPEILREKFHPFTLAFELDGDGPRFMQDRTLLTEDAIKQVDISNLLIDTNETHFNKPGTVTKLCPNCVAVALFTLQTNSPEGGRGHFTSLRGGGPLTTLVTLDPAIDDAEKQTLWEELWINILEQQDFNLLNTTEPPKTMETQFPWLSPSRLIKAVTKRDVFPQDISATQVFWAMPRRIYLIENIKITTCDLCGKETQRSYKNYQTRPNGISYSNDPVWRHPLSPKYSIDAAGDKKAFRHLQAGGFSYRIWPSIAIDGYQKDEVAKVVSFFLEQRRRTDQFESLKIHAFGYDMKSNKARCWYETTFPLYTLKPDILETFTARTEILIQTATDAASMLRSCIKEAWFKRPGDAKGDTAFLVEAFLSHTEADFYSSLSRLKDQLEAGEDGRNVWRTWHRVLARTALHLFDYWTARGDFGTVNPRRIAQAHRKLSNWLNGKKLKQTLAISEEKDKAA